MNKYEVKFTVITNDELMTEEQAHFFVEQLKDCIVDWFNYPDHDYVEKLIGEFKAYVSNH